MPDDLHIDRAHRVGKKRSKEETRYDGSKYGPRPIVAKFLSWKQRENVLSTTRSKEPDAVFFYPDLSTNKLQRHVDKTPELMKARKEGKMAYCVLEK